jgi:hypothetical protein
VIPLMGPIIHSVLDNENVFKGGNLR